jgi:tRNA(Ile)-lysidine synthase
MHAGDRVCAAVSGGADSVALLRVLLELRNELGIVLFAAHFNHRLRGADSDADEAFVAELARVHGLPLFRGGADVRRHALERRAGIEATARSLRYEWVIQIAGDQKLDAVATAHTLDDQAETVLMKFLRGAGTRGLAGVYPELTVGVDFSGSLAEAEFTPARSQPGEPTTAQLIRIVRPLLQISREQVEAYLTALGQDWREDPSNLDPSFNRNRVRHELLPLLEHEYNPNLRQGLSEMAEVARSEEQYWREIADRELKRRTSPSALTLSSTSPGEKLRLDQFSGLPVAVQRRLLKRFVERADLAPDFEHIENLRRCALGEIAKTELPGGWLAQREVDCLELREPHSTKPGSSEKRCYSYSLPVPGEVSVPEIAAIVRTIRLADEDGAEAPPGTLLADDLLGPELTVRNWHPGDRYYPAYSGSEQKLKRLFLEYKIPADERPVWPVVLQDEQIVWVRGLPVARDFAWKPGSGTAIRIEVQPI